MLIYAVEDEAGIRELECYALEKAGFETCGFEDGRAFWEALETRVPDLILLDVMLPGEDGFAILRRLRSDPAFMPIPVIMISARTAELDRVKGLDFGADDYMCKPFSVMEMISRVKARLRGSRKAEERPLRWEGIFMRDEARAVTADGENVELAYKEYELLKLFLENPGVVLRREELLNRIWGQASAGRTLDVHIRSLRAKLKECGRFILTVRNVGYKLDREE